MAEGTCKHHMVLVDISVAPLGYHITISDARATFLTSGLSNRKSDEFHPFHIGA